MREKDLSQGKPRESRLDCRIRLMEVFEDTLSMIAEEKALSEAVELSVAQTKFYSEPCEPVKKPEASKLMKISFTKNRIFQAARLVSLRNPGKRVAVLNFANPVHPGGGVKFGSSAQEESLCRCSTLYPVLDSEILRTLYYSINEENEDAYGTDVCLYSPGIKVIKSDVSQPRRLPESEWLDVDVITCAAPNYMVALPPSDEEFYEILLKRGRKVLDAALDNGVNCLVLGVFGCGVFCNDPAVVANAYTQLMDEYCGMFDEVEFAIFYWGDEVANYKALKEALLPL